MLVPDVLPEGTDPDHDFYYVDISAVDGQGRISLPQQKIAFSNAPSRARRLTRPGDSIVSTVRTYLRAVALIPNYPPDLVASTGFAVLRSRNGDPRFLNYSLRSEPFIESVVARSVGVSYPAITASDMLAIETPCPSPEDQRRIADFLDDRVSRIDRIIAARRGQVAATDQLERSRWAQLDDALDDAPWVPVARVLQSISDGPFGSALSSKHYSDSGTRVIRLGNVGIGMFRDADKAYIPNDYGARLSQFAVNSGDVIMAGLGDERWPLGRSAVVPADIGPAIIKADCYRVRLADSISPTFAALVFSGPKSESETALLARGSTRARLNTDIARGRTLPLVSQGRQSEYVRAIREMRADVAATQTALSRSIELLTEYKQSLITAAVTGQLDVTTASTRIPE